MKEIFNFSWLWPTTPEQWSVVLKSTLYESPGNASSISAGIYRELNRQLKETTTGNPVEILQDAINMVVTKVSENTKTDLRDSCKIVTAALFIAHEKEVAEKTARAIESEHVLAIKNQLFELLKRAKTTDTERIFARFDSENEFIENAIRRIVYGLDVAPTQAKTLLYAFTIDRVVDFAKTEVLIEE